MNAMRRGKWHESDDTWLLAPQRHSNCTGTDKPPSPHHLPNTHGTLSEPQEVVLLHSPRRKGDPRLVLRLETENCGQRSSPLKSQCHYSLSWG